MHEEHYEELEAKVRAEVETQRRYAGIGFGVLGAVLQILFMLLAWAFALIEEDYSGALLLLTIGALFALFAHGVGWLALCGAFDRSMYEGILRRERFLEEKFGRGEKRKRRPSDDDLSDDSGAPAYIAGVELSEVESPAQARGYEP